MINKAVPNTFTLIAALLLCLVMIPGQLQARFEVQNATVTGNLQVSGSIKVRFQIRGTNGLQLRFAVGTGATPVFCRRLFWKRFHESLHR